VVRALILGCGVLAVKICIGNPIKALGNPIPDFLTALIDKGSMTAGQMLMLSIVALVAMMALGQTKTERFASWPAVLLAVQVAALIVNFKRGSWFCAIILVGAVLVSRASRKVWVVFLAAILALLLLPPVQVRLKQLGKEFNLDGGGRLTMWFRVTPFLIQERPMGVGYGSLTSRIMRYASRYVEPGRNHLHANLPQVLVETGWLGLAAYTLWMFAVLRDGLRWTRRTRAGPDEHALALVFLLLFAGLLLNGFVEYNFGDTELMIVYAVIMGAMGIESGHAPQRVG
jgi:O-antigen ligase